MLCYVLTIINALLRFNDKLEYRANQFIDLSIAVKRAKPYEREDENE